MTAKELFTLLKTSRLANERQGITGMLLYVEGKFLDQNEGRFIQVLEGNKADVQTLYQKIKKDKRHSGMILLTEATTATRNFANWTMGFSALKLNDYEKLPGYFELDENFLEVNKGKDACQSLELLVSFYKISIE